MSQWNIGDSRVHPGTSGTGSKNAGMPFLAQERKTRIPVNEVPETSNPVPAPERPGKNFKTILLLASLAIIIIKFSN